MHAVSKDLPLFFSNLGPLVDKPPTFNPTVTSFSY
jgi:hypothetical protein